ncbi:MAG: hypothetical protein C7B46_04635 [Sulfobacillus benefaciens]|uniref:Fibronectin type-III domain-containing protein n=1 Tax=Sulfobacillus benefaciens TaxID=453960 RepID=A0A2T2XJQ5_9FIRM|nr:MAG: hypothetical protein C7B46_04635 [Sulfobacillus benefaciens]
MVHNSPPRRYARYLLGSAAAVSIMLVPIAYGAGWLADLSQVRPVLTELNQDQQQSVQQQKILAAGPPTSSPSPYRIATGAFHVTLTWAKVPLATSYIIYRAEGTQSFSHAVNIGQVSQPNREISFVDNTVTPGRSYTYWVAPNNAAGQGPTTPAVTVHTFLTWQEIFLTGARSAAPSTAQAWTQGGMGLLPKTAVKTRPIVWSVGTQLYSPFLFSPQASKSTWLTKRWTTWTLDDSSLQIVNTTKGIALLSAKPALTSLKSLTPGSWTPQDLALWYDAGSLQEAIVTPNSPSYPVAALILNRYGQAVALTSSQGSKVTLLTLR